MANYQAMWLAELAQAPEGNDEAGGSGGWAASIKEVCVCGGGGGGRLSCLHVHDKKAGFL